VTRFVPYSEVTREEIRTGIKHASSKHHLMFSLEEDKARRIANRAGRNMHERNWKRDRAIPEAVQSVLAPDSRSGIYAKAYNSVVSKIFSDRSAKARKHAALLRRQASAPYRPPVQLSFRFVLDKPLR